MQLDGRHMRNVVTSSLFRRHLIPQGSKAIAAWMNATALILTALPEYYWKTMFSKVAEEFRDSSYLNAAELPFVNPFEVTTFVSDVSDSHSRKEVSGRSPRGTSKPSIFLLNSIVPVRCNTALNYI